MSVIIKDMEVPQYCGACHVGFCNLFSFRLENCPLSEVPQHGRLIDADALEKVMSEGIAPSVKDGGFKHPFDIIRAVANAPTIVEAEE